MDWWILFSFVELNLAVVAGTLKGGLGHGIIMNFGVGGLNLALVEHGLQRDWLVIALAVEEFDL
jgi:hypothetical protein